MRRFLATALALLFLVVGVYCAVFYGGMYLKIPNRDLSVPFRTVGKELHDRCGTGRPMHPCPCGA